MDSDIDIDNESEIERELRKQRLQEFYHLTHVLFTKPERLILYKILKDYQRSHDIERFIIGLNLVLRTYTKLELLKYVRYFIWEGHIKEFDRLTKFHMRFRRRQKGKQNTLLQVPQASERLSINSASTGGRPKIKDVRVFTLVKDPGEDTVGFSIRGGSEHGLGVYISDIEEGSAAEKCGLEVGDKILEANNVSFKGVASSSAVKVLTGFSKVKLVIQRARKVPEWRLSREKTSWIDVHDRKLISGEFEECGITHHIRGLETEDPERRVSLKFGKTDRTLGFNVRGGREYGVGIYVSKVDRDGVADKNGVRVGDQIIDVNGVPFDNITHTNAVEVLKGKRHLILTLKDVGRFPAFKELYAEYTWSDTNMRSASSMTGIQEIRIEDRDRQKSRSMSNLFYKDRRPSALQSEIFLPNENLPSTSRDTTNGGDDFSLSDLEHWTHTVKDHGYDNNGYDHDATNVVVHVEHTDAGDITDVKHVIAAIDSDNESHEHKEHLQVYNTESVNHLYAKIDKRTVHNAMTYDGTQFDTHDEYDSVPVRSIDNYVPNEGDDEDMLSRTYTVHNNNTEPYSEFSFREKIHDPEVLFSSDDEIVKQPPSVSGSLYAKVKDIGARSFKVHQKVQGQPQAGSSRSNPGSITSEYSNTSTEENRQNQQTLQIRKVNGIHNANSEDSDDSDGHGRGPRSSRMYVLNKENDNGYESDTDQKKSSKGKGKKGSYSMNEDQLDLDNLEGRLQELEKRQTNIGVQELSSLSPNNYEADSGTRGKSTWKAFKSKIKGSLRLKPPRRNKLSLPKDEGTSGSDVTLRRGIQSMVPNTIDDYNMATFEEAASKMLNQEEYENVMKNVKMYHGSHDLDLLVEMLLVTLDTPEKILLLRDVRGIIYPLDIVRFDNRVNKYEIEAYQKLSLKLHLPLNHKQLKRPRKTIITTEIGKRRYKRKSVSFANNPSSIPSADVSLEDGEAEDGHFHIRPLEQVEKEDDVVNIMRSHLDNRKPETPTKLAHRSAHQSVHKHVQERKDRDDITEQFAYLDQHDKFNLDLGSSMDNHSEYGSHGSGENGCTIVHLSKNKPTAGIELYETEESGQREVRIQRIDPRGAAHDDNDIEEGMTILAIDRHKVDGCSKEEVMAILQKCYAEKQRVSMKLILHKHQSTDL